MSNHSCRRRRSKAEKRAADRERQRRRSERMARHAIIVPVEIAIDLVDDLRDAKLVSLSSDNERPETARAIDVLVRFALMILTRERAAFDAWLNSQRPTKESVNARPTQAANPPGIRNVRQ